MKKACLSFVFLLHVLQSVSSQNLEFSVYSQVSILTAGSGDHLYEAFGHSAIRVKDPLLKIDHVFNYGVFDYSRPNFYGNFVQGRLEYFLSVRRFNQFIVDYKRSGRWMKEQILDLTKQEKEAIFHFLRSNAQPENAYYLYDPYFNNCSTKIRDIVQDLLHGVVELSDDYLKSGMTMRKLMNKELPWNTWGNFGINLALGNQLDQGINFEEYMYLPDYLYLSLKNAKKIEDGIAKPLVKAEITILDFNEKKTAISWINPLFVFSMLFLLSVVITYKDIKRGDNSKWLDFSILFTSGLIGVLIIFLWFFTDHKTAPNNFNILWGFTPNLITAFFIFKKKKPVWLSTYFKVCLCLIVVLFALWVTKIQLFSMALLPLLGLLTIRYWYLSRLLTSKK